jgi:hypothetical protein
MARWPWRAGSIWWRTVWHCGRIDLDKAASDFPYRDDPAWHSAQIAAVIPGFGPAWITAGTLLTAEEATLRLVRDEVPIRGRVHDTEGRPVAGMTIHAREIREADEKADKDALLASGTLDFARTASSFAGPNWLGRHGTWTTDGDGRFEVKGVGHDPARRLPCLPDHRRSGRLATDRHQPRADARPHPQRAAGRPYRKAGRGCAVLRPR